MFADSVYKNKSREGKREEGIRYFFFFLRSPFG